MLYAEPYQSNSLNSIFTSMMDWFFLNTGAKMLKNVMQLKERIVQSTI